MNNNFDLKELLKSEQAIEGCLADIKKMCDGIPSIERDIALIKADIDILKYDLNID